jgi:hypothetical protein
MALAETVRTLTRAFRRAAIPVIRPAVTRAI